MRTQQTHMINVDLENQDYGLTINVDLFIDFAYHAPEAPRYSGPLAGPGAPAEIEIDEVRLGVSTYRRVLQPGEYDEQAIKQACLEAATT